MGRIEGVVGRRDGTAEGLYDGEKVGFALPASELAMITTARIKRKIKCVITLTIISDCQRLKNIRAKTNISGNRNELF